MVNETIINITQYTGVVLEQAFSNSINNTIIPFVEPLIFLFFGFLMLITGQYIKNWTVIIGSGVWFLGLAVTSLVGVTTLGFSMVLFFSLIGILIILHGISCFYDQKEPNTVRLNDD